jgi:hypothetical protein
MRARGYLHDDGMKRVEYPAERRANRGRAMPTFGPEVYTLWLAGFGETYLKMRRVGGATDQLKCEDEKASGTASERIGVFPQLSRFFALAGTPENP